VLPLLIVLFIAVPIIELAVIIQVGQEIGLLWTLLILVADSVLGSVLMRSQGRAAWRRFNEAIAAGRPPAREVLDGVLVIFGGALLLTPGFVTDVVGLTFLLPPTRAALRGLLVRRLGARLVVSAAGRFGGGAGGVRPPGRSPHGYDVEGTATEIDPEPRRLP
jgi:UPF0716 protein FxsA